ncbi:substrate-binding domain-containing protein [Galbitalea sp. SE-J8]|uniref:sugar ABC transporter substrate-binding protein n=1 Tax=Galbitalea sp. SE-J8 TaxID=3054952 RepID=UPI00259CDAC4|nr:substrate-binding domain-containing protein [Galbitalea sp. SE-J8]MDM4762489.1 substrate-binding domain-containing protein [Galbitalea sp. SE-J8]
MSIRLRTVAVALVAAALIVLSGCAPAGGGAAIALLLPESKTARYEASDRPVFESEVARLGGGRVLYSNADQDAAKQQTQAEAALAQGVKVLVLDPVDAEAAISIVQAANARGVPVVAYDRLPAGGDIAYYVSFDNEDIGVQQATAFVARVDEVGAGRGILMLNGAPTDPNAAEFKAGAHSVIDASDLDVLAEFDTPDWSPDQAQSWVAGQITQFGSRIAGIYAGNDGTAGGAIAALKAADVARLPVVSGQDAELAGIQRIVAGDQYLTIYKAMRAQAARAAQVAVDLATGLAVTGDTTIGGIPATVLPAEVVTVDTIASTVVADGVYTIAQICTAEYAAACARAGLTGG